MKQYVIFVEDDVEVDEMELSEIIDPSMTGVFMTEVDFDKEYYYRLIKQIYKLRKRKENIKLLVMDQQVYLFYHSLVYLYLL